MMNDRHLRSPSSGRAGTDKGSTQRIEYDRSRLLAGAFLGGFATLLSWGALIVALAGLGHAAGSLDAEPELRAIGLGRFAPVPWWTALALAPTALAATFQFLGSVSRLQDGDPAFVLSPRGLQFRPSVFGERIRVPWSAIRSAKARRFKKYRSIVLRIDDIERYVPRTGLLGPLRRLGDVVAGGGTVRLRTPMAQSTWKSLIAELQRYTERYGRPPSRGDTASGA